MHTCADIIASVPFFEDAEEGFTTSLVTCLTPQVSLKGDIIVREGEVSREMYFIKSGAAQVSLKDESTDLTIEQYRWYGYYCSPER